MINLRCEPIRKNMKIVARKEEIAELERRYRSSRSEFVIVYGRRRIGKTFLVNRLFEDRFTFSYVGARQEKQKRQLARFARQLEKYSDSTFVPLLQNWEEAFEGLKVLIEKSSARKKVVFLDEMPWIDTPRSQFVTALEYFWNAWAAQRSDILLIACGSSTSWMVNKLVKNKGGLHNRITGQVYLRPFRLGECEEYLHAIGCKWDRYTVLQCYMAMGGVPYYMDLLDKEKSLAQNLDRLYFFRNAPMKEEFDELFNALFVDAEKYIMVMKTLAKKRSGLTRNEIIEETGMSGGALTTVLENLRRCDFVETYARYGASVRNALYRVADPYSLFYFKFLYNQNTKDEHWWTNNMLSHSVEAWQGFSFETICMGHLEQIKKKLGIASIATTTSSWRKKGRDSEDGTQIDLVIERADRIINLCEIKFAREPYVITKEYARRLLARQSLFKSETHTRKSLANTMVTTYGIQEGLHSGVVQSEVMMDDLF